MGSRVAKLAAGGKAFPPPGERKRPKAAAHKAQQFRHHPQLTENEGLGTLYVDYPEYKSGHPDLEVQKRHNRLMELRHTFVAHSGLTGMKLFIVPAGVASPISQLRMPYPDFAIAKRVFSDKRYSAWLKVEVDSLSHRLSADIDKLLRQHCPKGDSLIPIETGADFFKWKH